MMVKIRKYEQLLVTLLGVMTIIDYILQRSNLTAVYSDGFRHYNNIHPNNPFNYAENFFLPRVGVVLMIMAVYFWVNLFTIPQLRRAARKSFLVYAWAVLQVLLLSYLLAIGVNVASYYANPAWNNYGEFRLFALFGYNEYPLTNLWTGFDRAAIILLVYAVYAGVREYVVYRIENSGVTSNYRTLITNQIAASLFIFFLLPLVASTLPVIIDDSIYRAYFIFVPPIICVYFSNTYWLFPRFSKATWFSFSFFWRLAISTLLYSFPLVGFLISASVRPVVWPINWLFQLLIFTPITWMLYQQQKDKIRELKGITTALSKSTADLQFLRSQINPHFLFNILNTLYGTALIDGSKRTANGIQMLGDMMRYMLDDNHLDFIPLNNELNYLKNYITLQRLRVQDSSQIEIRESIAVEDCNLQIVPMLLIPFVENAFKHGINVNERSWIDINLTCSYKSICLKVRNSLHLQEMDDPEKRHTGIGLQNVKDRLMLFYEGRHQLSYSKTENEFIVELVIKPSSINHE
jgi:two-component system LytT family sensor kinase